MADEREDEDEREDPAEEVGPDGAEPSVEQTGLDVGEREGGPADASFSWQDELHDAFQSEPIPLVIDPQDGLPRPVDKPELALAPPFTVEHVVCIEDTSSFVELFVEEMMAHPMSPWCIKSEWDEASDDHTLFEVGPHLIHARGCFAEDGTAAERECFAPNRVIVRFGLSFVETGRQCEKCKKDILRAVRPKRERCQHYKRQLFHDRADLSIPKEVSSFCEVRRSVGGACLSLKNVAVLACDLRLPPDQASVERWLDSFDRRRLADRAHEKMVPLFGLGDSDGVAYESGAESKE